MSIVDGPAPGAGPSEPAPGRRTWLLAVPVVATAIAVAAALVLIAQARAGDGPCGGEVREAQDARSLQHVLPGSPPPSFASAAPTSGPHLPGPVPGVRWMPIAPAEQVGALEAGGVLLQHRPDLPAQDVEQLRTLAGDRVTVAPNPGLDAPLVATAWQHRLSCTGTDMSRLAAFVRAHVGNGPDGHGTSSSTP